MRYDKENTLKQNQLNYNTWNSQSFLWSLDYRKESLPINAKNNKVIKFSSVFPGTAKFNYP